jgi:ATP-binding cassette subfamily F protein 3
VALAKLTLTKANFLILDEPTNHLDINAREALEDLLTDYNGTLLMVSHDRYFIDALATQVWAVANETVSAHLGNYSDYLEWLNRAKERELEQSRQQAKIQPGGAASKNGAARPKPAQAAPVPAHPASNGSGPLKTIGKEERQRLRKISQLEETISQKEARLVQIGEELNQAGEKQDLDALSNLSLEYQQIQAEIEQLYADWGVLAG